jgi:hypothetical protein
MREPIFHSEPHKLCLPEEKLNWFALKINSFLAVQMTQHIRIKASMRNLEFSWNFSAMKFPKTPPLITED